MRLMAGPATLKTDRSVFEWKRSPLVAMALEAAFFVGRETPLHCGVDGPVRVMAIGTGHGIFRHPMAERFLELGHHIRMTTCA